ncbi:putative winged helix-turn-helix DNA-binding domain, thioredoxin-like protein [Lupinus albus]|uniref:Putative winged helix-turn-helix DNA-binding domain, thioredoxin-like protein n=1 Tax=Lupinus albus TaxID=3870 RepID=A0A6A4PV18_LUPAL|nr:putative winged helix-turn-helix DNA-binding domain, thioredoxin-like protein [Lupinus albus]
MGQELEQSIPNNETPNLIHNNVSSTKTLTIVQPHSFLPKPTPPRISSNSNNNNKNNVSSSNLKNDVVSSTLAKFKFLKQRSNELSSVISRSVLSLKHSSDEQNDSSFNNSIHDVTEFTLSGLKVVVEVKNDASFSFGSVSFFSRSNCRDCSAVRKFCREKRLRFVEINVDVFPEREKELFERTGGSTVPKIFFNKKLIGGLVELNLLKRNGELEKALTEMAAVSEKWCDGGALAAPEYGYAEVAEEEEEEEGEMVRVVRVMRQRLMIQDRWIKMKIVRNCFAGNELVDLLIHHLLCTRVKAVEIGKRLCKKHFIHHVSGINDFVEGNHFYRFLEHEPFIPKCFNFRGATNDSEPKTATAICDRLTKIMSAILESYASDDRLHVYYEAIRKSEEFRRYGNNLCQRHIWLFILVYIVKPYFL